MPVIRGIFFLDSHSFGKATHIEGLFLVWVPLSKELHRGELESGTSRFSFGVSLILWIVFLSTLISSRSMTFCCPSSVICNLYFPSSLDLPLAAAAPEAGFSSCLSREAKCRSRIFCSKYRSTICFFSLVWCFLACPRRIRLCR